MGEYIIQLSKYFIVVLLALYTYEGFAVFRFREEKMRKGVCLRQSVLIFLFQFSCFFVLYLKSGNPEYLFFYALVQLLLLGIIVVTCMLYPGCSRQLVNNMCMLLGIGFIMISRLAFKDAVKQFLIVIFSVVFCLFIPGWIEKIHSLKNHKWLLASIGVMLLSGVLIWGQVTHGSKISFSILGITFQPSEFAKIVFIFFLAASLMEEVSFKRLAVTTVIAALHVIILVVSRDLGGALIFFVAFVLMVFLATKNYGYLALGILGGVFASVLAYFLFRHVQVRVQAWRDPWTYIDSQGFQVTQSLFAIGSGSWFGMGLLSGSPKSIPYVAKDSIFSAICEEMGVVSGLCLILICLSCFIMIMNIAIKLRDSFSRLVCFGIGVIYIFQVFLTIGGNIKFIPLTGVTLPLVSYGGSSVLVTLILFYLVQGFYIFRQEEKERVYRLEYQKKNKEIE